ncbi:MAG: hypothetical protein ACPLRP_00730 [Candidatus Bipolaricaulaceae bacterium]
MALGAAYGGARAMVTTSGGGFALMVEGLSLAGMIETPVVIHIGQRPGPATGLPTRTSQENLLFALYAGHGEFPRFVCAPKDQETAFHTTMRAFELAEKYQIPGIILPFPRKNWHKFQVTRGLRSPQAEYPRGPCPAFPPIWCWWTPTSTTPTAASPRISLCARPWWKNACARRKGCEKRRSCP